MMTQTMTYPRLWGSLILGWLLILTGCAGRSQEEELPEPVPVQEQGYALSLSAVTRSVSEIGDANCPDIKVFLTTADKIDMDDGYFHYVEDQWTSNITVKEERQYYIYGYMPENLTAEIGKPSDADYSAGADLTMSSLPVVTADVQDDICVIVGVQRTDAGVVTPTEGNFSYLSGTYGNNHVNLLMDHLYPQLELNFTIDAEYAKVRSIYLKKVELTTSFSEANVTVKLKKNKGIDEAVFTPKGNTEVTRTVYDAGDDQSKEKELSLSHPSSPLSFFCAPCIFDDGTTFYAVYLKTTYDVCDKAGDRIGQRESINRLNISGSELLPGQKKTVKLTVKPTYLYVLSDGDLDDPVVTIN